MDFSRVKTWGIPEGDVFRVVDSNNRVLWEKSNSDYANQYFAISRFNDSFINPFVITIRDNTGINPDILYSDDATNWHHLTWDVSSTNPTESYASVYGYTSTFYFKHGDTNGAALGSSTGDYGVTFTTSEFCYTSGNILSLIYGSNFQNPTGTFPSYALSYLFKNSSSMPSYLVNAGLLVLPNYVSEGCYKRMFEGNTYLKIAPILPATTLVDNCYYELFNGCTSLNYIKCFAQYGINNPGSIYYWVGSVSNNGIFVKSNNAIVYPNSGWVWQRGVNGIPSGWTVQNSL